VVTGARTFKGLLTVGDSIGLIQLASRSLWPFASLGSTWTSLQQSLAAVDRVDQALHIPQEEPGPEAAGDDTAMPAQDIEFASVSFGYGDKPVLSGASFRIPAGQRAALLGPSGSGKTTVLKLLLGMYAPDTGTIKLGDQDLKDLPLSLLRRKIAVVPQEPWLFPGSVRENIMLGRAGASEEEMVRAAMLANAHEFIEDLPNGYDTVLDERGTNLSGGQRQRLSLARAFLKDAPILFLDEATSSVDAESERLIDEAVERLACGRTVVTIAHSERMADSAAVRIRLDNGRASTEAGP
jgi:ABC-type multidrug transport system fused ATPase/permease subunit